MTADSELVALLEEVRGYPWPAGWEKDAQPTEAGFVIPFRLATEHGTLNLITTTMFFGGPLDVTVSGMAIECFFPQDAQSAEILRTLNPY